MKPQRAVCCLQAQLSPKVLCLTPVPKAQGIHTQRGGILGWIFTDYARSNMFLQGWLTQLKHHISGVDDGTGFQSSQTGITCQGHQKNPCQSKSNTFDKEQIFKC